MVPVKVTNTCHVHSMSTTISSNNHMHNDSKLFNYVSYLDEDSHVDMHCAGANFSVIKYSGYQCDVDLFLDSYDTTSGVDVVMATMAVQLSAGNVLYLVSSAALWFGDKMETLLFNANIAWDAGLELCTNPYDPLRELGIRDRDQGLHIFLHQCGNFIGLRSYKPNPDDVLMAMLNRDRNVVYLDPHDEYELMTQPVGGMSDSIPVSGLDSSCHCNQCREVDTDYLTLCQLSSPLDPTTFAHSMVASVNIADVGSTIITQRHSSITPECISNIFGCGIEMAKQTIWVMTQHGVRSAIHPLTCYYHTDLLSLWYRCLDVLMYSDTMHFKVKSINQNKCAQIFATDDFAIAYPVRAEHHIGDTLRTLAEDVGIPRELLTDNANAMMGPDVDFNKQAHFLRIKMRSIEPHNKKQNKGEWIIGELRHRWQDKRRKKNMPRCLWDYALVWCTEIYSHTYNAKSQRTGLERLTGDTPDISEWLDFDIYY